MKLTVKKQDDSRYWLHDKKGVFDGPFHTRGLALDAVDRIEIERKKEKPDG